MSRPESERADDAGDAPDVPLRRAVADLVRLDDRAFDERVAAVLDRYGLDPVAPDGAPDPPLDDPTDRERELVRRLRVLDAVPHGLTVCGPAYADTPIVYATRRVEALTGYPADDLRGENPRLFQGPGTEADAVADLREAIATWNPVTVELTNYRRDGTPFRNRVSLVPVADASGTVANWIGIQARVDGDAQAGPAGGQ